MPQVDANQVKKGMKIEIDNSPYNIVHFEYVKPGKGQSFTRVKLKNLKSGSVVEKTYKSHEKLDLADVEETEMRLLYKEADAAVFMDDISFEQVSIQLSVIGDDDVWLMEGQIYGIVFYKGEAVGFTPPTFMEMVVTETMPGDRGNTASGRVLKPAVTETGAQIQVPIFVTEGEKIKVDTRTGEYISRV